MQKGNMLQPTAIQALAVESKGTRLYSKTADNGEVVQALVENLAAELTDVPRKINLHDENIVTQVAVCYVDACAKAGTIPNKSGYCRAMGISRQALDYFLSHHSEEPSAERIRIILDSFAEMLNSAALASAVHPIISIFLSKALYNYRDNITIETELKREPFEDRVPAEKIMEKYKDLINMLPEE